MGSLFTSVVRTSCFHCPQNHCFCTHKINPSSIFHHNSSNSITPVMKLSFSLALSASFASLAASECITPNGLHILDQSGARTGIEQALLSGQLPFLFLPLAEPFIAELVKAETPIQFRLAQIHGSTGKCFICHCCELMHQLVILHMYFQ